MEQYPIPQEISSYEFRLVGSMTLKQFLKLASGLVFAYLVFHSNLLFLIRIPLSLVILLLGIGMAFFPFNEKPLEFWLISFFQAVYSPTIYIWKKAFSPSFFSVKPEPDPSTFQSVLPIITPVKSIKTPVEKEHPGQVEKKLSFPIVEAEKQTIAKEPVLATEPEVPKEELSSQEIFQMIKKSPFSKGDISGSPEYLRTPLPATPTMPDIVSGLVVDFEGRILEGAIVEIQDLEGNPIRAMRTNSLGQFQTATPLPKGQYLILVEKEPYKFDIIKLQAQGKIIAPLQIQAEKTALA